MINRTKHKSKEIKHLKMNNIIRVEREIKRRYMMTFGGNGDRNFTFVAYY